MKDLFGKAILDYQTDNSPEDLYTDSIRIMAVMSTVLLLHLAIGISENPMMA